MTWAGLRLRIKQGTHFAHGPPRSGGTTETAYECVCWLRGECLIKGIAGKVLSMWSTVTTNRSQPQKAQPDDEKGIWTDLLAFKEWIRAYYGSTVWSEDWKAFTQELTYHFTKYNPSNFSFVNIITLLPKQEEGKGGDEEDQMETARNQHSTSAEQRTQLVLASLW